jgi:membrane protease YdiL (CAAX protease family)
MINKTIQDIGQFFQTAKSLNRKVLIIFISIPILETISWYITSRRFFRANLFDFLLFNPLVYLYEFFFWYGGDFITLFVLPLLIIKFLIKEPVKQNGLQIGDYKTGFRYTVLFLIIMIILAWFASSAEVFVLQYPQLSDAKTSWNIFLLYEAALLIYVFAWEFIWRGYMLFGLKEQFGLYAILIQMIPFVLLHNGKPMAETFGAILAGIALGALAWRTASVFYGVITHFGVMLTIDLLCVLRYRATDYGIGLNSLINLFKHL